MAVNEVLHLAARTGAFKKGDRQKRKPIISFGFGNALIRLTKFFLLAGAILVHTYGKQLRCVGTTSIDSEEWTNYCKTKPFLFGAVASQQWLRERQSRLPDPVFNRRYTGSPMYQSENPFSSDQMQYNFAFMAPALFMIPAVLLTFCRYPWKTSERGSTGYYMYLIMDSILKNEEEKAVIYRYIGRNIRGKKGHELKFWIYAGMELITLSCLMLLLWLLILTFQIDTYTFTYERKFTSGQFDPFQRDDSLGQMLPTSTKCLLQRYGATGIQLRDTTVCHVPCNEILQKCVMFFTVWFLAISFLYCLSIICQLFYFLSERRRLHYLGLDKGQLLALLLLLKNIDPMIAADLLEHVKTRRND